MSSNPTEPPSPTGAVPPHPPTAGPEPDPAAPPGPFAPPPAGASVPDAPPPLPQGQAPLAPEGEEPPASTFEAPPSDGGQPRPTDEHPWRWWQGVLGLGAGFVATVIIGAVIGVVAVLAGVRVDPSPPALTIVLVFVQDLCLIGAALGFAAFSGRPRAWQFGLRRVRFWPTVGWAATGVVAFVIFLVAYQLLVDPQGEQTIADDLGINRGVALLILGGLVTIVMAPVTEELFFRGFFYQSLRNSLGRGLGRGVGIGSAAILTSALFMVVHAPTTPLVALPILGALGVMFCLVFEKTKSLYAVIALHALQNALSFSAVAENGAPVALGFGGAMLLGCILLPWLLGHHSPSAETPAPA